MYKKSNLLVPGIVMVAAMQRIPFTVIPTILSDISESMNVDVGSLGILTTIPLVMFAMFSSFAPKLANKYGLEKLFGIVLLLMAIGSTVRVFDIKLLYLGTAVIGMGIAVLNVLMPSIVTTYFPEKIGKYTMVYTSSMAISSALATIIVVPISESFSWKMVIYFLSILIIFSLVLWIPNFKYDHKLVMNKKGKSVWKKKQAWSIMIFCGLQSMLFYTGLTWLPTMAINSGISQQVAGNLAGLYSLLGLPLSIFLPNYIAKTNRKNRVILMIGFGMLGTVGSFLLFFQWQKVIYWFLINLCLGLSVGALFPYLMTIFSLKTTNATKTAELSGMAQTGGYLLASIGPYLFGRGYEVLGSWDISIMILILSTIVMIACIIKIESFEKIM